MLQLSGTASIDDIIAVADGAVAGIDAETLAAIDRVHRAAEEISQRVPTYGRTTGVGANKETAVDPSSHLHGVRLLRSHAVGAGPALPEREVRAMLAVRVNQLSNPGSGIDPAILEGIIRMLNENALPTLHSFGSVGTGDLTALAGIALALQGERPTSKPFEPMPQWGRDSALPFLSSSALTIAQGCLAAAELTTLMRAALQIYTLSFAALDGNPQAFSVEAAKASGSTLVVQLDHELRSLTESTATPARIQDPYALRVFPLIQAGAMHAHDQLRVKVQALTGVAQENPLFVPEHDTVVHHGSFYQAQLGLDIDAMTLSLAAVSTLGHARIRIMNEPAHTGLEPFLATGPAGSSGLMMVEYVAASAVAEMRNAAAPASLGTVVLSRGAEEDASFASQGMAQLQRSIRAFRVLLSSELIGATRLIRQRPGLELGPATARACEVAGALPTDYLDRDLTEDLALADTLLPALAELSAQGAWES